MGDRPKVGIGVIIIRDGKVLLGKRRNAHGENSWSPPGGHLEYGEGFAKCASREAMEEVGLSISDIHFAAVTNDVFEDIGKHYITIFMLAKSSEGTPELCEPDKCESWQWFSWYSLPEPLFLPMQNLLEQGYSPFEERKK